MRNIALLFSTVLFMFLITSCECTKVECAGNPFIYIDIIDRDTEESQLFGPNPTLNISDVNVFSQENGETISYSTVEFSKESVSSDPFLIVLIDNLMSDSIFISTGNNTMDTLILTTTFLPESTCCDETRSIDNVRYQGLEYLFNEWPIRILR